MIYKSNNCLKLILLSFLIFNVLFLSFFSINLKNSQIKLNSNQDKISKSSFPLQGKHIGWITTHGEEPYYYPPFHIYTRIVNDSQAMGAILDNITIEINSTLLSTYDILIIEEEGSNWTTSELADLSLWVQNGGSICILGDHGDSQRNVSAKFNVFYNDTDPYLGNIIFNIKFPIMQGVSSIYSDWPLASIDLNKSRDDLMILAWTEDNAPIIISLQDQNGRILWIVDAAGTIENSYITIDDNHLFANNSWLWLGGILGNEYSEDFSNWWLIIFNEDFNKPVEFYKNWNLLIIIGCSVAFLSILIVIYFKKKKK